MKAAPFLALLLLTSCQTAAQRPDLQPKLDRIQAFAERVHEAGSAAGLGYGVAVDGQVVLSQNLGYRDVSRGLQADDNTLWYVASTSKSFIGMAIALLESEGALRVDQPIAELLPDAQWPEGFDSGSVTLADFLGHTEGIGNSPVVIAAAFTGAVPEERFQEILRFSALNSNELRYSNLGYNIASLVVNHFHEAGWKDFLETRIFGPAGLDDLHHRTSTIDIDRIAKPHSARPDGTFPTLKFAKRDPTMNAAGGHVGSIQDLTRWAILNMDDGQLDGDQVLPEAVVRRAHQILRTHDRQFAHFQRDGWGMGWDVGSYRDIPMVSRFGSYNFTRSHLSFLPEHRVGVVALTNGPLGSRATDLVAAYAYDVLLDLADADSLAEVRLEEIRAMVAQLPDRVGQAEATQAARQQPFPRPLSDLAGAYEDEAFGTVEFTQVGDTLRMAWGVLEGPTTVFNADAHAIRHELLGSGSTATFVFDGAGPATAVEMFGRTLPRAVK